MRDEWPRIVDLFVVAMRLVEHATIANALDVAERVVGIGALGSGGFLGFVFRAHLVVIDAGQDMHTLATERFLRESVGLVYDFVAALRKHGGERAFGIVDFD